MSQMITATFENGVLKPDQPLDLPVGAKVRIIVEPFQSEAEREKAWQELEKFWEECSVDSGGDRMTRDQLHERR